MLKAQGKLNEALAAYEEICQAHPYEPVARSGLACTLSALQRWDEALALLATEASQSADWIAQHIRGMIFFKKGETSKARAIFERGLAECPYGRHRDYFRTALAMAHLAQRNLEHAERLLDEVAGAEVQNWANAIRVQVFGEQGKFPQARTVYALLPGQRSNLERELFTELWLRYVDRQGPQHDDGWLLDRQILYQLAA